jgi:hypothetical protein
VSMAPSVTLKEYFERILAERDTQNKERFDAQEKAIIKAEVAAAARFEYEIHLSKLSIYAVACSP